jgi:ADP-heptose:LPS heptosyltransferase
MHGQLRTALLTLITGAPVRIGWDRPRRRVWQQSARLLPRETLKHAWKGAREGSWLAYTDHITIDTLDVHAVDRYLRVGALLGFDHRPPDFSFPIPQDADQRLSQLLQARGIPRGAAPVVISPTTQWETKHWIGTRFAEVARHFLAAGYPVVLIGSGGERAPCRLIAEAAPGAVDLSGQTTLMELAALVRRSALCLTNDSGPMHLAVALDRPVVSIFGPTNPAWIGPYGRDGAVLQTNLPCAPCYLRKLRRCRYDHACMTTIETSSVIARIEKLLPHRPGDVSRVSLGALP